MVLEIGIMALQTLDHLVGTSEYGGIIREAFKVPNSSSKAGNGSTGNTSSLSGRGDGLGFIFRRHVVYSGFHLR